MKNWTPHVIVTTAVPRDATFLMVREWSNNNQIIIIQPAGHLEAHEPFIKTPCEEL